MSYNEAAGDRVAVGRATATLADVLGGLGRYSEGIERSEQAFEAIADGANERVRADLACALASSYALAGSSARAVEWSETALALAEQLDDSDLLIRAIGAKSGALFNLGRHREAVILARGMAALADASGGVGELALARLYLSIFVLPDDPRESLSAAIEGAELAARAGQRRVEVLNLLNAAETSIFLGRWSEHTRCAHRVGTTRAAAGPAGFSRLCRAAMLAAVTGDAAAALERLDHLADGIGVTEFLSARTTYLEARAVVDLAAGDLERSNREAAEAVSADPLGINAPTALAVQARSSLWLGDVAGANAALTAMTRFRGRWMAAERLTVEAGLAALEGRLEASAEAYRQAIDAWRSLDCILDLALCELDLVLLLGQDHPDATVAKEARDVFTQLGVKPFLQRLNLATDRDQTPR